MTTNQLTNLNDDLDRLILEGKLLEAFDKYYADDIVMQEGSDSPRKGRQANREYEEQFVASIAEFHGAELHGSAVGADQTYSEWTFDFTPKGGDRVTMTQVAARSWKDGKVVYERFYPAP